MVEMLYDHRINKIIDLFNKIKIPESPINPKTNAPYTSTDSKPVAHQILSAIKDLNVVAFPSDSRSDNFWCHGARLLVKIEILALLKQCEPSLEQYRLNFNMPNLCRMMTQLCKVDNSTKPLTDYLERIALIEESEPLWDDHLSKNMQASIRLLLHNFKPNDLHALIGIVLCALIPFTPVNFTHESHQFGEELQRSTDLNMKSFYSDPKRSKI